MNYLKAFLLLALSFLAIAASYLCWQVAVDMKSMKDDIHTTLVATQTTMASTQAALTDLRRTVEIAGGTLNTVRQDIRNEQVTLQAANAQTIATMKGIDDLVGRANVLVGHVDDSQSLVVGDFHDTTAAIQTVLDSTHQTVLDVDKQVNDPAIGETLGHLNMTLANVQDTSLQVDTVAKFYEKKLTSPRGFASTMFHGILQLITPGASLATAAK